MGEIFYFTKTADEKKTGMVATLTHTHTHTEPPFKVHLKLALASAFQRYPVSSSDDCLNKGNVRPSSPLLFGFFKHLSSVMLISAAKKASLSGIKAADPQDSKDSPAKCTQAHSLCLLICMTERLY